MKEAKIQLCIICNLVQPIEDFNLTLQGRKRFVCRECREELYIENIDKKPSSFAARANNLNANAKRYYGQAGRVRGIELERLLDQYQYKCAYCGKDISAHYEFDHIIPQSRGGENTIENIAPTCSKCNGSKGNLTMDEWINKRQGENRKEDKYNE